MHVALRTSNRVNLTSLAVFEFDTQITRSVNTTRSIIYSGMVMPNIATFYIVNSPYGEKPFTGFIRELRIWSEYRKDNDLFLWRYMDLKKDAKNLLHYYRMVGDVDNLRITESSDYLKESSIYDFTITNVLPAESPIRFTQDFTPL